MRRGRFTEAQILGVLKEHTEGVTVPEIMRKHGIARETFYTWRAKCRTMQGTDASRLKQLEEENKRLKRMVADQAINIEVLKEALGKE